MVTVRLPEEIEARLHALAKATGRSRSHYARQAIIENWYRGDGVRPGRHGHQFPIQSYVQSHVPSITLSNSNQTVSDAVPVAVAPPVGAGSHSELHPLTAMRQLA